MSLNRKKEFILAYEESLAGELSEKLLDRPKMSVWMILIPLIFVFHCQRHKRFVEGKKKFIQEWTRNKEQALCAAVMEVSGQEERDPEKWRKAVFHLPTAAQEASLRLQHLLTDHYKKILQATGSEIGTLVSQAYGRDGYALFVRRRIELEQEFSRHLLAVHDNPEEQALLRQLDHESALLYERDLNVFCPVS